jgi:hypothetical protein
MSALHMMTVVLRQKPYLACEHVHLYSRIHTYISRAFEKIKATAIFRKEEGIDDILVTDAEKFEKYFEQGKEEVINRCS